MLPPLAWSSVRELNSHAKALDNDLGGDLSFPKRSGLKALLLWCENWLKRCVASVEQDQIVPVDDFRFVDVTQ